MDLVQRVARRVAAGLPAWVPMDELIALGNLGLCQAALRFDPQQHCSFRVFAMLRIRGSMIDAFRGRNYPRLMSQMAQEWLGQEPEDNRSEDGRGLAGQPEELIDRSSPLEEMIEREQSVVISIDAVRARAKLNRAEGKVLDKHLGGEKLRNIAAKKKRSPEWARYTLMTAKRKLRLALQDEEEAA